MADRRHEKADYSATTVVNDWPEDLPIAETELDLFESELLDIITAMIQHT